VREMREGKTEFTVWGSPDTVRDLLYVDDQLEAILVADAAFENTFLNCSSNQPVTIGACAQTVRDALGWNAEIVYPGGTFKGTSYKTIDADRFLQKAAWHPKVDLITGVRRVIAADYGVGREAMPASA
jgi:GDP-L-fucose synthase